MRIKKDLISKSKHKIKCPYSMKAEFIIVHNTANDASAKNEIAYMKRNNNRVSYHIAVDDKEAIQAVPFNRNTWNAGDGANGRGNRKGIAVEICYSKSGGTKFDKAERNGAKVVARLLNDRKWGIDKVKKHQDFSGKYCPHRTLDRGWNRFLNMVKREMGSKPSTSNTKPTKSSKIAVDGYWGKDTTRALQRHLNTPVDGEIWGQYRTATTRQLTKGTVKYNKVGSPVIRELQKKVGAKVDGLLGPETVRRLQRYLKTPVDGEIWRPSRVVKEMQKRLNEGTF